MKRMTYKHISKYIIFTSLISVSSAFADIGQKAPLKVDFQTMIHTSDHEKNSLADGINESMTSQKTAKRKPLKSDKQKVTDFVDVEIGWGEAPKMVDRRFDSIGEPVIDMSAQSQTVELPSEVQK